MSITSHEFEGIARGMKGKNKTANPTVKAPKIDKKRKQQLVPYGNQAPQRREACPI